MRAGGNAGPSSFSALRGAKVAADLRQHTGNHKSAGAQREIAEGEAEQGQHEKGEALGEKEVTSN